MRFLSLAFALLPTSPFASNLLGQSPKAIIVSRLFAYEQAGPETVVAGRPALAISVQYDIKPSVAQVVEATCGDKTYTLAKDPLSGPVQSQAQDGSTVTLLAESYSFRQEFADTAGLNAALPAPDITVRVTRNGLTTNTVMRLANAVSFTPRITNFDALQNWNGDSLSISWTPIPGATFLATSIFTFRRADGTTIGDTSDNSEPLAWFFYTPGFFAAPR